jgi:cell division protein FtsQ
MAKDLAKRRINWRFWLRAGIATAGVVSTAVVARGVNRFLHSDPHFTLDREAGLKAGSEDFTILGLKRASRSRVLKVFEQDFGGNVFDIPIDERRRRLLAVDWVERASVSRVWPNRIVVRIWERQPVAFVNLTPGSRSARLALIDAQGVILDRPEKLDFSSAILTGVHESQSERERQERVRSYQRLMGELGDLGKQVSEVDVSQQENLVVGTQIQGAPVEVWMGDRNFKARLEDLIKHYPEIQRRTAGASRFDLRLDDRITVRD